MTQLAAEVLPVAAPISRLTAELQAFMRGHGVDERTTHHVALIVEEILTNIGTHGQCRDTPARVAVTVAPAEVSGIIVDRGMPFDPRQPTGPAAGLPIAERPVGGLGLVLVRKLSSRLDYATGGGENVTTFAVARP
jgi:anti-sigma regulatory factor (Ser/Thr protein kinase)